MTSTTIHPTTVPTNTVPTGALTTPGTRTISDSIQSYPAVVRSEAIKLSTVRSNAAILGVAASVSGLATWAVARFVTDEVITTAAVFSFPTVFTAVFAAVAGILMFSSEAQHGTLAPLLTAQPSKLVITAAKTTAAAAFGALLSIVGMAAAIAGSWIGGIEFGDTSTMAGDGGRALLFTMLASILGLGVGMIARHSAAAISGLLVWWLVIENLLGVFVAERFARFLPFSAGNALVGASSGDSPVGESLVLSLTENGLVFGGYAFGAVALGWLLLSKVETN